MIEKKFGDYTIIRYSFWQFWKIDVLEFNLDTQYQDAYVWFKKIGDFHSIELKSWVIEDIRNNLGIYLETYKKEVKKAKKFRARFYTCANIRTKDNLYFFFIDGGVYFNSDVSIKRVNILSELGI